MDVEGAVIDEDKVVLRWVDDLREPACEKSSRRAASNDYKVLLGDFLSHGSLITTSRKREKAGKMCDECRPKASWWPGFM